MNVWEIYEVSHVFNSLRLKAGKLKKKQTNEEKTQEISEI